MFIQAPANTARRLAERYNPPLADTERRAIPAALEPTKGNKTQAAALLGLIRTKPHIRLKPFGLTA